MSNISSKERNSVGLYQSLKCLENIQILNFKDTILLKDDAKAIGKILSDFKNIKELDLRNC